MDGPFPSLHILYRSAKRKQAQDRGFKPWLGQPKNYKNKNKQTNKQTNKNKNNKIVFVVSAAHSTRRTEDVFPDLN